MITQAHRGRRRSVRGAALSAAISACAAPASPSTGTENTTATTHTVTGTTEDDGTDAGTASVDDSSGADGPAGSTGEEPSTTDGAPTTGESNDCDELGDPFDATRLRAGVEFLASKELGGRTPGTPGDLAAREYIADRLACLGIAPGADDGSYQQPFVNQDGTATANVVGILPGTDARLGEEIIVIGAHHDHLGLVDGELLLGANDNASGVIAMLAIAEALASGPPLARTVAFVAFGSEETASDAPYVEGSAHYVANAPSALPIADTVYMINLDMVGTYADDGIVYAIGTYDGMPASQLFEQAVDDVDLEVGLGEPPEIGSSDHFPFCAAGIPFVFMWTDDPDCYHAACDLPDSLDYPAMAEIAALVADVVRGLAEFPELRGVATGSCGE
jgi:hypothetical protein